MKIKVRKTKGIVVDRTVKYIYFFVLQEKKIYDTVCLCVLWEHWMSFLSASDKNEPHDFITEKPRCGK
jgi:hypothetical protein